VSSDSTKKKVGVYTTGLVSRATCTRVSSRRVSVTVRVLFGGAMEVGTRDNSETVCKVVGECCSDRVGISSTRVTGIMGCLMARVLSISRMDKDMKECSRRTSSMEMGCSIRMIRLFMGFGKIMSLVWSIWSRAVWEISDSITHIT